MWDEMKVVMNKLEKEREERQMEMNSDTTEQLRDSSVCSFSVSPALPSPEKAYLPVVTAKASHRAALVASLPNNHYQPQGVSFSSI